MTEAEVVEMLNTHASNAMNGFTIYLTLTFAYLTAIYLIGAKLSRLQIGFVSLLYIVWAIAFSLVSISHLQAFESVVDQYPEFMRSPMFFMQWVYFGISVTVGGLLICIGFTYSTRRQTTQD
jgi:hypothetical protein